MRVLLFGHLPLFALFLNYLYFPFLASFLGQACVSGFVLLLVSVLVEARADIFAYLWTAGWSCPVRKRGEVILFEFLSVLLSGGYAFIGPNCLLQLHYFKMVLQSCMGLLLGSDDCLIHKDCGLGGWGLLGWLLHCPSCFLFWLHD